MVKFKYTLSSQIQPLINSTVVDYPYDYIIGYLEEGTNLRHSSLYIVCELEDTNSLLIYKNPIGVVAKNERQAIELFSEVTSKNNGSAICEVVNRCDNLKVEPI